MLHSAERREATDFGFQRRPIPRRFVVRKKSYRAAEGNHIFHDRVERATREPSLPPAFNSPHRTFATKRRPLLNPREAHHPESVFARFFAASTDQDLRA